MPIHVVEWRDEFAPWDKADAEIKAALVRDGRDVRWEHHSYEFSQAWELLEKIPGGVFGKTRLLVSKNMTRWTVYDPSVLEIVKSALKSLSESGETITIELRAFREWGNYHHWNPMK